MIVLSSTLIPAIPANEKGIVGAGLLFFNPLTQLCTLASAVE